MAARVGYIETSSHLSDTTFLSGGEYVSGPTLETATGPPLPVLAQ
jgi:hypothetical protein